MDESWIYTLGPWAVFGGMMIEGEIALILAGYALSRGLLDPASTFVLATLGGATSDNLYFWIGRRVGPEFIRRSERLRQLQGRAADLLRRWGRFAATLTRFAIGFRIVLPVSMGAARFAPGVFAAFNLLGAALFAVVYLSLGYVFGRTAERWIGQLGFVPQWILGGLLAVGAVVWAVRQRRLRKPQSGAP